MRACGRCSKVAGIEELPSADLTGQFTLQVYLNSSELLGGKVAIGIPVVRSENVSERVGQSPATLEVHVTVLPAGQVSPVPTVSVTILPLAASGPAFVTVTK